MAFYPTDRGLVLVKEETTARGTYEDPNTGGGVAIYTTAAAIPQIEYDSTSSERMSAARNKRPSGDKTGLTYALTIETELTADGSADTVPHWVELLKCFDIVDVPLSYTIKGDSTADQTVTIDSYVGGLKYTLTNCKGRRWSISGEGGQIIKMSFEVVGIYNEPTETAIPTLTADDGSSDPLILANAGLGIGNLDYTAICASSFTFSVDCEVSVRKCINTDGAIKDITPGKRTATFEATTAAFGPDDNVVTTGTKNIYEAMQSGDVLTVFMYWGDQNTDGANIQFQAPGEVTALNMSDQDGVVAFSSLSMNLVSNTDDGDFTLLY